MLCVCRRSGLFEVQSIVCSTARVSCFKERILPMLLRTSLMKMCHFVPIKISTYLVNWRTVNLLAASKGLGRGIDIRSLMIETPKIFVGGMAIEHLALVKIIKFKFRCWLGRKSCLMLIGGIVNDETTSGTCTLVVIPSTAASHITLDHKIKIIES